MDVTPSTCVADWYLWWPSMHFISSSIFPHSLLHSPWYFIYHISHIGHSESRGTLNVVLKCNVLVFEFRSLNSMSATSMSSTLVWFVLCFTEQPIGAFMFLKKKASKEVSLGTCFKICQQHYEFCLIILSFLTFFRLWWTWKNHCSSCIFMVWTTFHKAYGW